MLRKAPDGPPLTLSRGVLLAVWVLATACDAPAPTGAMTSALGLEAAPTAVQRDANGVVTLRREGGWLVTPRWSPSGRLLLAAGDQGVGNYVLDLSSGRLVWADEAAHGRTWFVDENTLCSMSGLPGWRIDLRAGSKLESDCATLAIDELLGVELARHNGRPLYHESLTGALALSAADGTARVLVEADAWDPVVSPDASHVAFMRGSLEDGTLYVVDLEGREQQVGPGIQPGWTPDGSRLVFSRLTVVDGEGADAYAADLFVWEAATGAVVQLTSTAEAAETEPAVSPDGTQVAYADWVGGSVGIIDLPRTGGQP